MANNKQFITEYIELCRKHKTIIEPCGWSNLIVTNFYSEEAFKKALQEYIEHYEKKLNIKIG